MKDYYKILGVSKSATISEIKQAYRKLAHKYHPDKNQGDDQKFKEINEAYQILSDPQKKAQYDQFGTADQNFNGFNGFDQNASGFSSQGFSGFGGLGDIFEDFFGGVFSQIQTEIEINLTAAILGETLSLQTSQGEKINLNIPPGTQDGQTFRFPGKGMVTKRGKGDLLITIRVKIPKRISREQKEILENLKNSGL